MSIKQAIEALGKLHDVVYAHNKGGAFWGDNDIPMVRAMADARAALAALRSMPQGEPVATIRYERGTAGKENDMPKVVSCNWLPDGVYSVYATPHTEAVRQALTDPENQPNQFGVTFGMRGPKMYFAIGHQSFTLDYAPEEPGEFEFMRDMLTKAMSVFTPDVKPEAVRMSEAWQPMKTAPKDGTHILAALPDRDGCCYVICWADVDRNIRRHLGSPNVGWHMAYDGDFLQRHDGPTHWMPLPPPPVEQATAARLGVKMGDV